MKKVLIILIIMASSLLVFSDLVFSQELPQDSATGRIAYMEVVKADGISQSDLYFKVLEWFAFKYNSANDVIQLKDENSGKVIGKGNFKINYYTREPSISHTISVFTKDGRYKYVITGLNYKDNQGDTFNLESFPKGWAGKKKLYTTVDKEIKILIADLKKHISQVNNEDDW